MNEIEKFRIQTARNTSAPLPTVVADSWRRCLETYNLVPDAPRKTDVLTAVELDSALQNQEILVASATSEIERLFQRLASRDCMVSLASPNGVKLLFRCAPYWLDELKAAGVLLGSVWKEESQGTNGVGTCIKIGHAVSIVGEQHFNATVSGLTCTVAPIFGAHGELEGVLNVTSMRPEDFRTADILRDIVERSARRIEVQHFCSRNNGRRLVSLSSDGNFSDTAALSFLAIDDSNRIADLTSSAPLMLSQSRHELVNKRIEHILSALEDGQPFEDEKAHLASASKLAYRFAGSRKKLSFARTTLRKGPSRSTAMEFVDPRFSEAMAVAERLVKGRQPIVVQGETGVGKTTFAHALSQRASLDHDHHTAIVNCALSFEAADIISDLRNYDSFTLILDQADEMSVSVQQQLISLMDESLLAARDIVLITVCTKDLAAAVAQGNLRRDLSDRIQGTAIALPPLRSAPSLRTLIHQIFGREADKLGRAIDVSAEALAILLNYHWPGNLRELQHTARHASILSKGVVTIAELPQHIVGQLGSRDLRARSQSKAARIEAALGHHNGNVAKTAKYLGISRATLYRHIQISQLRTTSKAAG